MVQLGADFGQDLGIKIKGQCLLLPPPSFPFLLSPVFPSWEGSGVGWEGLGVGWEGLGVDCLLSPTSTKRLFQQTLFNVVFPPLLFSIEGDCYL